MLPIRRAIALAAVLALAVPTALAQSGPLRVEISPSEVVTLAGSNATALVRVYNGGLSPVVVTLTATNATGDLQARLVARELSILPGGSSATDVVVNGTIVGDQRVTIHVEGRHALSGAPVGNASATLRVRIVAPNGTANESAPSPGPGASPPPAPRANDSSGGPVIQPAPSEDPARAPAPAAPPPAPRALVAEVVLEARRGTEATYRVEVHNPADVAQRFDITLSLPLGWGGTLGSLWLDVGPRGTADVRGLVAPGSQARDDEGQLRIAGPGGAANVRLVLRVAPDPIPVAPTPAPDTSASERGSQPAAAPTPTPTPKRPVLRVVPEEIGARPGTSVVFTVHVTNLGDVPFVGQARADIAPLRTKMDDPAFTAAARDDALVTFVVTVPSDVAEGTTYEGLATTTLSEASAPFVVRIETAEVDLVTQVSPGASPGWLLYGAAGLGAGVLGIGVLWRRWPALGLLPLYARFAPHRALEHPRRASIVALLRAEPGLTLAEVRRRLGMSNGVARHHLQLLEAAGVVRAVADGSLKRLWPVGEIVKPVPPLRERALDALREKGSMRASDLAESLGVSRQALHYHVKRLVDEGRVVAQREANEVVLAFRPDPIAR